MAWEAFSRDAPGGFHLVALDHALLDEAPIASLPLACEITIGVSKTISKEMTETEGEIDSVVGQLGGRVAGHARSPAELWILLYLPSEHKADRLARVRLPGDASLSVAPAIDPNWSLFDRLRPAGIEEQSLLDHRMFASLVRAGDNGARRVIEHVVTGVQSDRVDDFVHAAAAIGVTVTPQPDGNIQIVHEVEPAAVTDTAWTIRQIAERHGGVYEGWTTELRTGRHELKRKSRWFRRS